MVVGEGPFDPSDGRTVVELELVLGPEADLRALSAQELRYEGAKTDPRGERFVVVRTTVPHALELARYDLHARPRRLWARRGREASGAADVAGTPAAAPASPNCSWPPDGGVPPDSSFRDYPELAAELMAMDGTEGVDVGEVGVSLDEDLGTQERILGVQFGPLEKVRRPPTLVLLVRGSKR